MPALAAAANHKMTWNSHMGRGLLAVCLLLTWLGARAAGPLDGVFEVRSATTMLQQGVVELSAVVSYPNTSQIRAALMDGVTLTFDLEVTVSSPRRFWFDADIVALNLRRELSYHVISDRYVVRNADGIEQATYPTLDAVLEDLGRIERLPIVVTPQLRGDGPWNVRLRAGVRRGRMPDALRSLAFWSDAWHRTSEWYVWTLER
jgi:hypothetical protein